MNIGGKSAPPGSGYLMSQEPGPRLAFPNAYVSADEPPRGSVFRRALCLLATTGFSYLGLVILVLSIFTAAYSPVSQVASDYGVGAYALWMDSGFFLAGVGMVGLAATLVLSQRRRTLRAGGALMVVSGVALVFDSFFATDIEGSPATTHGTVHAFAGVVFFIVAALALVLVSRGFGKRWFVSVSSGLLVAVAFLALDGALALNASGLGERIAILVIFTSTILTAAKAYGES
jgi:hypothetical membrane protein